MAATNALSEPERLFARAVAQRRVRLLANHSVGPYVCDFVHRRSRTIVEIDGREFHSGAAAFRRDRQRQNWLVLQGWLVLRYAAADIYQQLERSADEVVAVIHDRGRRR
ncbi:endonuclease domain-containing protein [Nocardia sp. NBC_01327]|uniref:endonuclease domain-containing protein n=1 Tax=Nocardia sp. NBC_01327 TaxID=2903593 RepID=UPI003FA350AD